MGNMQYAKPYIIKRGITGPWRIDPKPKKKFHQAVVIPALAEADLLPTTLNSLNKNNISILKDTLVVVVVNNALGCLESVLKNNQVTLKVLKSAKYNFTLGIVDASSLGFELPKKHAGVGLARKIGMDLSLKYLVNEQCILLCTDADLSLIHI